MSRKKTVPESDIGESAPVIGSTEGVVRLLSEPPDGPVPKNERGRYLARLLRLHPNLQIDLRADGINALTEREQQTIISDIQTMLKIKPLRTTPL